MSVQSVVPPDPQVDALRQAVLQNDANLVYWALQSFKERQIGKQVDQILLTLVDQSAPWPILSFVRILEETNRLTELARICELGARSLVAYASNTKPQISNPNLSLFAKKYAAEYRKEGWEKRAKFMDCVVALQYTPRPE